MQTFDIGRTFSRTWQIILKSLASAGVLLLIVQVVSAGIQWAMRPMLGGMGAGTSPADRLALFTSGSYWLFLAITVLLGAFAAAGALHGMLRAADDNPTTLGDCLTVGVVSMLPMLGLMLLWGLGVGLGMVLLIVPGLILLSMWSCSMQALIAENCGVIASFGRSAELTKGSRIMIFVTLLIYIVAIYVILFGVLGAIVGFKLNGMTAAMNAGPLAALVMIPVGWVAGMVQNALLTSIYAECVTIKGGSTEQVSGVFA